MLCRGFLITAILVCSAWTLFVLFGQGILLAAAGKHLEQAAGLPVQIESARMSWTGSVQLSGVSVGPVKSADRKIPNFTAKLIRCRFALLSMLRLRPRVSSLGVYDFMLYAEYDALSHRWNLAELHLGSKELSGRPVPKFSARNGTLRFCYFSAGQLLSQADIGLDAKITSGRFGREYRFVLNLHEQAYQDAGEGSIEGLWQRKGSKGSLELAGRLLMEHTPVLGNAWNLEQISLACEYDEKEILLRHLEWKMGDGQARLSGLVRKSVRPAEAEYDLEVSIENHRFGPAQESNTIIYSREVMGFFDPRLRRMLDKYQPKGTGDVSLRVQGRLDNLAASQINGTVLCRDIQLTNRLFPYTMENLQGPIQFSGQSLYFESLKARHGNNQLRLSGAVKDFGPQKQLELHIYCPDMAFDQDLYSALREEHKKLWFSFAPSGSGQIDYRYHKVADGKPQINLEVNLKNARAVYDRFPYPLSNISGRLVMEPNEVTLERVVSRLDNGGTIELDGTICRGESGLPEPTLNLRAGNIPIDSTLRAALSERQRQLFDDFQTDARADMEMEIFSDSKTDRIADFVAEVKVKGGSMLYRRLPVPVRQFSADVQLRPEMAFVKRLTGQAAGGRVELSGQFFAEGHSPQRPGYCINLRAEDIQSDPNFIKAVIPPGPEFLSQFEMEGRIDVDAKWSDNMPADYCPGNRIEITCRNNKIRFGAGQLAILESGFVTVDDQQLVMKNFVLKDLTLNEKLESLLPDPLRRIYSSFEPGGRAAVNLRNFVLQSPAGQQARIVFDGSVGIDEGQIGAVESVGGLKAQTDFSGEYFIETGLSRLGGAVRAEVFEVMGRRFQNVGFPFVFDPNSRQIFCRDITGSCCGGNLLGRMVLQFPQSGDIGYQFGLAFENVQLEGLLAPDLPAKPEQKILGRVEGSLDMAGVLGSSLNGRLEIHGSQMRLGTESLLGKVLTAMQLQQPMDYVFSDADINAYLKNRLIICDSIRMSGKTAIFTGSGTVDLENKQINVLLTAFDRPIGSKIAPLEKIIESLGSALAKVEVKGTLDNPQIIKTTLPIIRKPFELLGPHK